MTIAYFWVQQIDYALHQQPKENSEQKAKKEVMTEPNSQEDSVEAEETKEGGEDEKQIADKSGEDEEVEEIPPFVVFIRTHHYFLDSGLFMQYYSRRIIFHTPESVQEFMLPDRKPLPRSEEHTSELQSLMRISYAVFCL